MDGAKLRRWLRGFRAAIDLATRPTATTTPEAEARRLMSDWGSRAYDIACGQSAAETAGLFDKPDSGFWNDVAIEIKRRGQLEQEHKSPALLAGRECHTPADMRSCIVRR